MATSMLVHYNMNEINYRVTLKVYYIYVSKVFVNTSTYDDVDNLLIVTDIPDQL